MALAFNRHGDTLVQQLRSRLRQPETLAWRALSQARIQALALTGLHRPTLSQALVRARALSLSLCRLCCATRFVAEVRSQRAQLSETRSQRAVSQQSVVGQSARRQLFALRLPKLQ